MTSRLARLFVSHLPHPTLALFAAALLVGQLSAQGGGFISFHPPDAVGGTDPRGINKFGVVTGVYFDAARIGHGFIRLPRGQFIEFDVPGLSFTTPEGINDQGQVAGEAAQGTIGHLVYHGFLRTQGGSFVRFDPPGSVGTFVDGINNSGNIAGSFADSSGGAHGFLRDASGNYTIFDIPTAIGIFPNMISDDGTVVGSWYDSISVHHAFVRDPAGAIATFDAPGAGDQTDTGTEAIMINSSGVTVGRYLSNDFHYHGFFREPSGAVTSFDFPGALDTYANAIDSDGSIYGSWAGECCNFQLYRRDPAGNLTNVPLPVSNIVVVDVNHRRVLGLSNGGDGFIKQF